MTSTLQFIIAIVILIISAKTAGYVFLRLKQPSVLGELIMGVILGLTYFQSLIIWSMPIS